MTRVAITTDRFDPVAPAYAVRGLEPAPLPCLRVDLRAMTPSPMPERRRPMLTSGLSRPRGRGSSRPDQEMPEVEVAAVGESTAAAVAGSGGRVVAAGRSGRWG